MATLSDPEEFAIPLVRRSDRPSKIETERPDRMSPARSGALAGFGAGSVGLMFVHAFDVQGLGAAVDHAAKVRGVPFEVAWAVAYLTAAALGSVTGAVFGNVTRYLRKWPALALWGVIFFVSVSLVCLGASNAFHVGIRPSLAGPIVGAMAIYGFLLSFSLPIRRRR